MGIRLMSRVETSIQNIRLKRLNSEGLILDIGGGGEGLVSRIEGERVCAVDIQMNEIREAQIHGGSSNWVVGDGRYLCFSDSSFDVVTLWFSLGYMRDWTVKKRVLEEAHRVLKTHGTISILSSKIPDSVEEFVFWALFTLPDGTLSKTGYGVRGNQGQTMKKVLDLITPLDFTILNIEDHEEWFSITATRS